MLYMLKGDPKWSSVMGIIKWNRIKITLAAVFQSIYDLVAFCLL